MKVIPSLSDLGWVTDSGIILSKLLAYYILTDAAQSVSFQGNLINLPETYYKHINDPMGMGVGVREDLTKLLSRYFEQVSVQTEVRDLTESRYGIALYASVIDDNGVKVNLGNVVELDTTGLKNIIEVNNYGDAMSSLNSL